MTARQIPLEAIARALREQGATADECIAQFKAPQFRAEIHLLEDLLLERQGIAAANAGQRKANFLRSVRKAPTASCLRLASRLRGAVAAWAVLAAGTAVAAAADPVAIVQDVGREIGISGGSEQADVFELRGVVASLDVDAGVLVVDQGGDRQIEIQVDDETEFVGAKSLEDIRRGSTIAVEGTVEDGRHTASWVELIAAGPTDQRGDPEPEAPANLEPTEPPGGEPVNDTQSEETPGAAPETPASEDDLSGVPPPTDPTVLPDEPDGDPLPELPIEPPELPLEPDLPLPDIPLPDLPQPDLPLVPPLLP